MSVRPSLRRPESIAADDYRQMLIDSNADDIQLTAEVTGIPANMLRKSLERSGFKPVAKQRFARDLPSVAKS
jgi:NAD(P)H-dependent flavin oxidoreductase YrpB (nitropropane dioxygenase family)